MKSAIAFYAIIISVLISINLFAQWSDSLKVYWLEPVEVTSQRLSLGDYQTPVEKDQLSSLLNRNGFNLIRKGVFFAQDIYADGFKKGDVSVVIDGERYHCACPNRMDSPLSRVNPLDLESLELSKTSGNNQSGLGGKVSFHRTVPIEPISLKAGFSGSTASSQNFDGSLAGEGYNHRISLRYSTGAPYRDSDGRSFKDLYGYKDDFNYKLGEVTFHGKETHWKYGAAFTYTENVSFPYLKMDEINNKVFSTYVSYDENKLYVNYTDHLMTNQLRESMGVMESDAKNFTIGAVGSFYEAYFRNWKIDNIISTPMITINNNMIPDVKMYSVSVYKQLDLGRFSLLGRGGLVHHNVGEESSLLFYKKLYAGVKGNRWFPTFGVTLNYSTMISEKWGAGALLEAGSEAPETEYLFVAVQKPMKNPNWSGNPRLKQPVRVTLRGSIHFEKIRLEAFATQVWNYVNLNNAIVGTKPYITYENVDAYLMGINFGFNWRYIEINASYTYAQNTTNESPLSEIQPLSISTQLTSPIIHNIMLYLKHTYNNAQNRIDVTLNENTTPGWNRVDIGAVYNANSFLVSLEVSNLLNALYYQHLSYLRDPFTSSKRVFEPGRTVRLNFRLNSVFE